MFPRCRRRRRSYGAAARALRDARHQRRGAVRAVPARDEGVGGIKEGDGAMICAIPDGKELLSGKLALRRKCGNHERCRQSGTSPFDYSFDYPIVLTTG